MAYETLIVDQTGPIATIDKRPPKFTGA